MEEAALQRAPRWPKIKAAKLQKKGDEWGISQHANGAFKGMSSEANGNTSTTKVVLGRNI